MPATFSFAKKSRAIDKTPPKNGEIKKNGNKVIVKEQQKKTINKNEEDKKGKEIKREICDK